MWPHVGVWDTQETFARSAVQTESARAVRVGRLLTGEEI